MDSAADPSREVGCPIRKSPDQRSLPSPRSLSQGATSFIASRCQGIHQMPFSSLENLTKIRHAQGQTHPHGRSAHAKHHGCLPPPDQNPAAPPAGGTPEPEPAKARNISGTTRASRRHTPPEPPHRRPKPLHDVQDQQTPPGGKARDLRRRPGSTTRAPDPTQSYHLPPVTAQ